MKFDNELTEVERTKLLAYVKKEINNVDYKILELVVNGKSIKLKIDVEEDGEITFRINRRKDGFRIVSIS